MASFQAFCKFEETKSFFRDESSQKKLKSEGLFFNLHENLNLQFKILLDSIETKLSSQILLQNILSKWISSKEKQRVLIFCLDHSVEEYQSFLLKQNRTQEIEILFIDGFSDPRGWKKKNSSSSSIRSIETSNLPFQSFIIQLNEVTIQELILKLIKESTFNTHLLMDSLSTLLQNSSLLFIRNLFSNMKLEFEKLENKNLHLNFICVGHLDLHPPEELKWIQTWFTSILTPLLPTSLPPTVDIGISILHKRKKSGKVSNGIEYYRNNPSHPNQLEEVVLSKIPSNTDTASSSNSSLKIKQAKVEASKSSSKTVDPTSNLTFNLKLTDEERKTRDAVVLPYRTHLDQKETSEAVVVNLEEEEKDYEEGEELEEDYDLDI